MSFFGGPAGTVGLDAGLAPADQTHNDLFATIFQSEVLAAYQENLLLGPLVRRRSISNAIRETFVKTWKMAAERHGRDDTMVGQDLQATDVTIELDERPIAASYYLDDIDLLKAHFDMRKQYSDAAGVALARTTDSHLYRLLVNAARYTKAASDESDFPNGGGAINKNALNITASASEADRNDAAGALLEAIMEAQLQFDQNDVPIQGLNVAVPPVLWHALLNFNVPLSNGSTNRPPFADQFISSPDFSALGQFPGRATPLVYRGVQIWNSPSVEQEDFTGIDESRYQVDASDTFGIIWHQDAVAMLEAMNITMESQRIAPKGQDFFSVRKLHGGGTLRGEAAIELTATG